MIRRHNICGFKSDLEEYNFTCQTNIHKWFENPYATYFTLPGYDRVCTKHLVSIMVPKKIIEFLCTVRYTFSLMFIDI